MQNFGMNINSPLSLLFIFTSQEEIKSSSNYGKEDENAINDEKVFFTLLVIISTL